MNDMPSHTHIKDQSECTICGIQFDHVHPDNEIPREFFTLNEREVTLDKNVDGWPIGNVKEWWEKYTLTAYMNGMKKESIPLCLQEQELRVKQEIREEIEKLKYTKESPSVFEVSFNLAVDNILKEI